MLKILMVIFVSMGVGMFIGSLSIIFRYENGKFETDRADPDMESFRVSIKRVDKLYTRNYVLLKLDTKEPTVRRNNISYYENK